MLIWRPCSSCHTTDYPKHQWKKILKGGKITYYLSSKCVLCHKEDRAVRNANYRNNPGVRLKIQKKQKQWRRNNPLYMKRKHREWRANNKDKIREWSMSCYIRNRKAILAKQKKKRLIARVKKWGDLTIREIHVKVNSRKSHPFREMERARCQKSMCLK